MRTCLKNFHYNNALHNLRTNPKRNFLFIKSHQRIHLENSDWLERKIFIESHLTSCVTSSMIDHFQSLPTRGAKELPERDLMSSAQEIKMFTFVSVYLSNKHQLVGCYYPITQNSPIQPPKWGKTNRFLPLAPLFSIPYGVALIKLADLWIT